MKDRQAANSESRMEANESKYNQKQKIYLNLINSEYRR